MNPTLGMVPDRPRPVIPPPPPPPRPRADEACTCDWCSQFTPRISVSTPFGVESGRWGYDPRIERVAMGNLDPARRGRGE